MMKKLALLVVLTVSLGLVAAMYATPASAFLFGGGRCATYCAPVYCAPVCCAPMCCVPYCGPWYGCCYPCRPPMMCKGMMPKKAKAKK